MKTNIPQGGIIIIYIFLIAFVIGFVFILKKYLSDRNSDTGSDYKCDLNLTPAQAGKFIMGDFGANRLILAEALYLVYKKVYSLDTEEYKTPTKKIPKTNYILKRIGNPEYHHDALLVDILDRFDPTSTLKIKEVRRENVESFNMLFTGFYDSIEDSFVEAGLKFSDGAHKTTAVKYALIGLLYLIFGVFSMYSGVILGIIAFVMSFAIMFICLYYLGRLPEYGNYTRKRLMNLKSQIEAIASGKTDEIPKELSREEIFLYGFAFNMDYRMLVKLRDRLNLTAFGEFFEEKNSGSRMELTFNEALFGSEDPKNALNVFTK